MLIASVTSFLMLGGIQADVHAAQALVDESAAKLKAIQSVTFTMTVIDGPDVHKEEARFLRGGYESVTSSSASMIMTPKEGWILFPTAKMYRKLGAMNPNVRHSMRGFEALSDGAKPLVALAAATDGKLGDKTVLRVEVKPFSPKEKDYLLYDPKTKLPAGEETSNAQGKVVFDYGTVNLDPKLTPKDFEWTPPAGWKEG